MILRLSLLLFATVISMPSWAQYCDANAANQNYEWIKSIEVNSISVADGAFGYSYNTTSGIVLKASETNSLRLTPGFKSSTYNEYWKIYVDANQNGQFDTEEVVYSGSSRSEITANIQLPDTVLAGNTRMRILMSYGKSPAACGSFSYGEVEDYLVSVEKHDSPPHLVERSIIIGFAPEVQLDSSFALRARYNRNGIAYKGSYFFYSGMQNTRTISLTTDSNSDVTFSVIANDGTALSDFQPDVCDNINGDECIIDKSNLGPTSAIFKEKTPSEGSLVFDFENLFPDGNPWVQEVEINGVKFSTTAGYIYTFTGAPYSSDYIGFINLTVDTQGTLFSKVSFLAHGGCTNCTQTVNVYADEVLVHTFELPYSLKQVSFELPVSAQKVRFDKNFRMDDLVLE